MLTALDCALSIAIFYLKFLFINNISAALASVDTSDGGYATLPGLEFAAAPAPVPVEVPNYTALYEYTARVIALIPFPLKLFHLWDRAGADSS